MKKHIRTLWGIDEKPLWNTEDQREALRLYLNDVGFYTLTGAHDSLDIYAVENAEPMDIKIIRKALDKIEKTWYALLKRKEVTQ